jgi:phosphoglycerate dehydrogenase-like enzyme
LTLPKVVFPEGAACIRSLDQLDPLRAYAEVVVFSDLPPSEDELVRRICDADAIVVDYSRITASVMDSCPKLRLIAYLGVGVWTVVDVVEASRRRIAVAIAPAYGTNAVAEHALALMLAAARNIVRGDREVRQGIWNQALEGSELSGKTLGIIGLGPIGARMADLGRCLGMRVICYTLSPTPERAKAHGVEFVSLQELLQQADFVSIHIMYSETTHHLIGPEELALLKPSAILVNTARAEVVDTQALVEALRSGRIRHAAIDVFETEPVGPYHPLFELDNVTLTPHWGYNTPEAKARMLSTTLDNVIAFLQGRPKNIVNPEVL